MEATLRVTVDADYVPQSIAYLASLSTASPQIADALQTNPTSRAARKLRGILWFRIYSENANFAGDATHSEARLSFENTNASAGFTGSNILASAKGQPLLTGLAIDWPGGSGQGIYDFFTTTICGKTGDKFQIVYGVL
jgi:hypothetical protein